jgi:hypothetical protein
MQDNEDRKNRMRKVYDNLSDAHKNIPRPEEQKSSSANSITEKAISAKVGRGTRWCPRSSASHKSNQE